MGTLGKMGGLVIMGGLVSLEVLVGMGTLKRMRGSRNHGMTGHQGKIISLEV